VSPWLIAIACASGAALIAAASTWLRLRWPLAILSLLLAAIATQLFLAARGQNGFHDLAAMRAQMFTVLPALGGTVLALIASERFLCRYPWHSLPGVLTLLGLAGAVAMSGWTMLL
jgi:hypothetical protein